VASKRCSRFCHSKQNDRGPEGSAWEPPAESRLCRLSLHTHTKRKRMGSGGVQARAPHHVGGASQLSRLGQQRLGCGRRCHHHQRRHERHESDERRPPAAAAAAATTRCLVHGRCVWFTNETPLTTHGQGAPPNRARRAPERGEFVREVVRRELHNQPNFN
jgi:hypothetical protein